MNLTTNIKELFNQIDDKQAFLKEVSKEFGIATSSIRTNWISNGDIPAPKYGVDIRGKLVEMLQNKIQIQNGIEL